MAIILLTGALFFIWRLFIWGKFGYPVDINKLLKPNFFLSILGIIAIVLMIVIYGRTNPHFSWMILIIGVFGGVIVAVIEAFSYDLKRKSSKIKQGSPF